MTIEEQLQRAVLADPSSVEAWSVYADWLQAQGRARGELAVTQLGLRGATEASADAPIERQLLEAEPGLGIELVAQLRRAHARMEPTSAWMRDVWELERTELRWTAGFVTHARLSRPGEDDSPLPTHAEIVRQVLTHPSLRLVREVVFGPMGGYPYDYAESVHALVQAALPGLSSIRIAEFAREHSEISWSVLGPLGALWARYPDLQSVVLRGASFDLERIDLPRARAFRVQTGGLLADNVAEIARARWPALEVLELWFGDAGYDGDATIEEVAPLLAAGRLPRLTDLGLMNAEFTDDLCRVLVDAPLASQLIRLDLSLGTMGDDGAAVIAGAGRARFPALRELDVRQNYLTEDGVRLLQAAFPGVSLLAADQEEDEEDPEDRYVSVGE